MSTKRRTQSRTSTLKPVPTSVADWDQPLPKAPLSKAVHPRNAQDFDEYFSKNQPTDLNEEVAILRTLLLEARYNAEQRHNELIPPAHAGIMAMLRKLLVDLETDECWIYEFEKAVAGPLSRTLDRHFGSRQLTMDEIWKLTNIIKTTSGVVETMKKIQEQQFLKVDITEVILIKFAQVCVLPYTDRRQQRAIAEAASNFNVDKAMSMVPQAITVEGTEVEDDDDAV